VVVQVVNGLPKATVILTSNNNPSDFGQSVKFTATISSSGATGSVTFMMVLRVLELSLYQAAVLHLSAQAAYPLDP